MEFEIIQSPTKLPTHWDKNKELDWVLCLKEKHIIGILKDILPFIYAQLNI